MAETLILDAEAVHAHAIDAFVVATALQFESAVIATGDPRDIRRLASPFRHLRILSV